MQLEELQGLFAWASPICDVGFALLGSVRQVVRPADPIAVQTRPSYRRSAKVAAKGDPVRNHGIREHLPEVRLRFGRVAGPLGRNWDVVDSLKKADYLFVYGPNKNPVSPLPETR